MSQFWKGIIGYHWRMISSSIPPRLCTLPPTTPLVPRKGICSMGSLALTCLAWSFSCGLALIWRVFECCSQGFEDGIQLAPHFIDCSPANCIPIPLAFSLPPLLPAGAARMLLVAWTLQWRGATRTFHLHIATITLLQVVEDWLDLCLHAFPWASAWSSDQ